LEVEQVGDFAFVCLGKALNRIPLLLRVTQVVTGDSLTRRLEEPKKSLCCLMVEIPWQINKQVPSEGLLQC